jgi:hypothetical protein
MSLPNSIDEILEQLEKILTSGLADQDLSNNEKVSVMTRTIQALIDKQVIKARIDELVKVRSVDSQLSSADIVEHVENRLNQLKDTLKGGLDEH